MGIRALMKKYSDQKGISGPGDLCFSFDGRSIQEDDTPRSLKMEKEDIVDVYKKDIFCLDG